MYLDKITGGQRITGSYLRALAALAPKLPPFDSAAFDQAMRGSDEELKGDFLSRIAANAGYHTIKFNQQTAIIVADTIFDPQQSDDIRNKAMRALVALSQFTPNIFSRTLVQMIQAKHQSAAQGYDVFSLGTVLDTLRARRPKLFEGAPSLRL